MIRRLPTILGALGGFAALLLIGPVAVTMALLRSSSDSHGPALAAQLLIAALVLAVTVLGALAGSGLGRLIRRLLGR